MIKTFIFFIDIDNSDSVDGLTEEQLLKRGAGEFSFE